MKSQGVKLLVAALAALLVCASGQAQAPAQAPSPVDPALPVYPRVEGLKGKLTLVGSSTISQLAAIWGDSFKKMYPDVQIDVAVKGSVNAVPAVINGDASFGLLSRQITPEEVKAFHDKFGYLPTVLTPSLEPMAIYVHKDNPIKSLTLAQLDAIFSTTLKRGAEKPARTWGDVGLQGKWANVPIVCEGRSDDTGSQVFFQTAILGNGEFRKDIADNGSNLDLVKSIAATPGAIGFAGSLYALPDVKAVPLSWREGDQAIGIHEHQYPLVRPLHIVVNRAPDSQLSPLQREFIKYVFSQRGQQDVIIGGFVPVPARPAQIALDAVGLSTLN